MTGIPPRVPPLVPPLGSAEHDVWLAAEHDRLLDFGEASRHPDGGFAWLLEDGTPDLERPVELWITCRMTHCYALAHLQGRAGAAELVDHGVAALRGRLRDPDHGGWYAAVGAEWATDTTKAAYGHAFVVLAASSAVAAGRPGAQELLDEALLVLEQRFWDDEAGMVVEEWDSGWTRLDGYRGVNANMHAVEAMLAAADVTGDRRWRERALRITTRVVHDLAPAHDWRIPEHFDSSWTPVLDYNADEPAHPFRPFGATIGHWLEWSRLALDLHEALVADGAAAPDWLVTHAVSLFEASVREGWSVDGGEGFVYTVDFSGRPVVRQRLHWVAAEAIATAAALHAVTGDPSYARHHDAWWDHVDLWFLDREQGSWHHELDPSLQPSAGTWSGKPDLYHALQATLFSRLPLSPTLATALRVSGGDARRG